ncbi:MAG: DUF4838 domain-containing protein [Ruminococcaceae bacterium]|nr:DUF4838 domain-containing protein [Oscillospiraceae bacterium]
MIHTIRPVLNAPNNEQNDTLIFASQELQKYLSGVSEDDFSIIPTKSYDKSDKDSLYLGVRLSDDIPMVESADSDDAIFIDSKELGGVITGSNARSVLIGVYRYLKELGFKFLRPGKDGEYFPELLKLGAVKVCEKASYRHRAICIEGSVFQKNLTDVIDWLPKAAMNGYFVQFQLPRVFFDRWYAEDTPYRQKIELSDDDIRGMVALGEAEMKKRSLMYHGVGHGWTTQAFGIDGSSWSVHEEPEEKYRDVLAEVNGERKLWQGIPLNTNLCYSNPKARSRVTDNIVEYLKIHPEVSYLHFWLGDGFNNNCECDNCRKKRTSDYYVQMLNELDKKLSDANLNTKIVFLIYVDLLWKPLTERLINKERFVLMFAPISRSYSTSFNPRSNASMRPYELNKLVFPTNVDENLAYLKDWKKDFDCDSFDFDYHFMWDHYYDFAQYEHAKVLWGDIKNLYEIGLNGLVSCQIQRAFLPSCLSMNVMADTLWNKEADFDSIADGVLMTEFGPEYKKVKAYLSSLSAFCCAKALRGEEEVASAKTVEDLGRAVDIVDRFLPEIEYGLSSLADKQQRSAWEKLKFHAMLYKKMLEFYEEVARDGEIGKYSHIIDMALANEMRFKDEFDAMYFIETFENHIVKNLKNRGAYNF